MNNSKMWLVVNPTVGLPLFFIGVATTSLIVHAAILTHTTWYPAFYSGKMTKSAQAAPAQKVAEAASAIEAQPAKLGGDAQSSGSFVVMADGRKARLVFDPPAEMAAVVPKPAQ